jgi:hypothetical protein
MGHAERSWARAAPARTRSRAMRSFGQLELLSNCTTTYGAAPA